MTRRARTLGLLVDWLEDEYQNKVLSGVDDAARQRGAQLLCFTGGILASPYRFGERRNFIYDLAGPESLDGIIIMSGTLGNYIGPKKLARYCERYRPLPMTSIGVALEGIPSVLVDNARGMHDAIAHLVQVHGYRRIAFIRGPGVNEEAEARYRVYRSVLAEHNLPFNPDLVTLGNFQAASGIEAVRIMLDERRVAFDAVVAANDFMALGAMEALHARGIRIPHDVALIGFDDLKEGRFAPSPLTTVRQPLEEQGALATRMVLDQLDGKPIQQEVVLHTELVTRQSCGCSPHAAVVVRSDASAYTSLGELMSHRRERILDDMRQAVRMSATEVDPRSADRLLDVFMETMETADIREFRSGVDSVLLEVAPAGNVDAWQAVITALREHCLPALERDAKARNFAEELWHEARAQVGSIAERAQAQIRLEVEQWSKVLRKTGEALFTTLDVESVMRAVADQLPRLRIRSAFLALYEGDASPDQACRLVLSFDGDRRQPPTESVVYPARQLIPPGTLPEHRRFTYVVEPLFFEREQLGFVFFEMGPRRGVVYETLRDQIGSALKGALLVRQVVDETARRQMAERERVEKEAQIAARIQTSILPRDLRVDGLELAATMLPAPEVGGDYYDVLPTGDGCWLGIGDVAGHGLQTGLVMMMMQSVVATVVRHSPSAAPRDVLRILNGVLFENVRHRLHQDEHATVTLIRYQSSGRLTYAGAHEEILVFRADTGRCEAVPTPGTWVAAVKNIDSGTIDSTLQLGRGDLILLYTDGVTQARNVARQPFGSERLRELFESVGRESPVTVRDRVMEAVREWTDQQEDDVTVVVARYTG